MHDRQSPRILPGATELISRGTNTPDAAVEGKRHTAGPIEKSK